MNFKTLLLALIPFITLSLNASINHSPPSFTNSDGKIIYVDFKSAVYNISYDPKLKKASSTSTIIFESFEEGMPAFDLKENPVSMFLDNESISSKVINSPDKDTWFRVALKTIKPGLHTFVINAPLNEEILFLNDGVSSAFWFTDLGDRGFLETYLPANFEYDQLQITLNLDFKSMTSQKIFTNGAVTKLDNNRFKVEFPEAFTSSSLYFHTAPVGRYPEINFTFPSIDGRRLPVTIYAANRTTGLEAVKNKVLSSLETLESKYGPFLHPSVTVFIAGNGGMEYFGATMTDTWAINHELTHSYFARGGLMPANGNSGWIDEAITSWSDEGSGSKSEMKLYSNMAGNSPYRRYTHYDAYSVGKSFMYYLNYKFQANGGITTFLNHLIQTESFKPMTTDEFIKKISFYYSEDLAPLFTKHIYSSRPTGMNGKPSKRPVHMKMNHKEMRKYL